MKTVRSHGNYSVIQYDENFVTIDFSDENVGLTLQTFDNLDNALDVFESTVETFSEHKAQYHDTTIVKMIISSNK